jgi:hypothetical protein
MSKTEKRGDSAEDTEFGQRMIEGLSEALAGSRGEIALPVHVADDNWIDEDDAPDLSAPDYQAKFAAAAPRCGRPKG